MGQRPGIPKFERVHRCPHCSRSMARDASARHENPWCDVCLTERLEAAVERYGRVVGWEEDRGHIKPIRGR
jgi:hypothetical protein